MSTLHMQTEIVHSTARQMMQISAQAHAELQSLLRAEKSLESAWQSKSGDEYLIDTTEVLRRLQMQYELLMVLAERVEHEVTEWEKTDQRGASAFQSSRMNAFWSGAAALPMTGGWQNYSTVLALPAAVSVSQFLTNIPTWLGTLINRLFPSSEIASPTTDTPTGAKTVDETPLGKLIKEFPSETPPTNPPAQIDAPPGEEQWWLETPVQSQQGLNYDGGPTAYGCVPTSTKMVLDYWHQQNENNQTTSAQSLLDLNTVQKEFTSRGMSIDEMSDEVANLGYRTHEPYTGKELDFLKEQVAQGPVIALVHLDDANNHLNAIGKSHAVVVTGISPDTNEVRINDPWVGKSVSYSWEDFNKSWGSSFGKDPKGQEYATNALLVIRP